jgi:2-polyprenyl-3-methyl-5-hydroxy-6-metoxy-1,4-benzoquinol methylase
MDRWQNYSPDPNSEQLMALRREAIRHARTYRLIDDRVAYLCELAKSKAVLDIGVVEHTSSAADNPGWLHGNLKRHAASCLGVDVLEKEVALLQEKGFNVICADVTRQPLPQKFDVIIAGEVLEHLDAPGPFMASCAAMLESGGRLALTVPNPWYANVVIKNIFRRSTFVDSSDHVAWYEAAVLYELGQRHQLRLERTVGIGVTQPKTFKAKLFFGLSPLLILVGFSSELFAKSIIYEFVKI